MTRLIDADRLEDDCNLYDKWDAQIVKEWLKDQPTVDAVPVIRCNDCIHHHGHDCENMNYRWTSDDFYCGWAERKEE